MAHLQSSMYQKVIQYFIHSQATLSNPYFLILSLQANQFPLFSLTGIKVRAQSVLKNKIMLLKTNCLHLKVI